jgi:hypothetical protein
MSKFSTSFTLGKASAAHGANVEHNNREFLADNINENRIKDNITYVQQNIRDAYSELFDEAVDEYNAKQKQPCRKIADYYEHIANSKREEAFYEIVVQFGDSKNSPVGSDNGELVKKLLDEYMKGFKERNPNLHVFNATLHMDEASPHIHVDFIPVYTQGRKNGLTKGVSMKSALIEQGFNPKGKNQNQLVMWEDSEMKEMEKILKRHGHERDVKKSSNAHMNVNEYKESQDIKKIPKRKSRTMSPQELTEDNIRKLQLEKSMLETEKEKLLAQKHSPWKSFYYSSPEKQSFVQSKLDELQIPYRETENGFEAQECYVEEIRKLEKDFKPIKSPHRETLRDNLDKFIMQSQDFNEVLARLKRAGYEVKQGKYISVKPKYASQLIRLKSLGEDYSEQALQNRLEFKKRYENNLDVKIKERNQDALDVFVLKTVKHYTISFRHDVLPMKKIKKKKPFSWTNDIELDKLSALNKKIQSGATLESLKNNFVDLENSVSKKQEKLETLQKEMRYFTNLYNSAVDYFVNGNTTKVTQSHLDVFAKHRINKSNYERLDGLAKGNSDEINALENELHTDREKLKESSSLLTTMEKVVGGTYVQSLIDDERNRRQSDLIPSGTMKV